GPGPSPHAVVAPVVLARRTRCLSGRLRRAGPAGVRRPRPVRPRRVRHQHHGAAGGAPRRGVRAALRGADQTRTRDRGVCGSASL
ncbi:MAG: hypothetical protein AVDCRST_MAG60-686, partial [uncultured Nocardioides sp.]